jgi:uncharacterized membrane protein
MVATTAACCALAWRHASLVIALLGLVGGFATPLLLSSGSDRPFGLFGYVLLLDVALLVLAQRRRWPMLALLSLAGTVFYQAVWIGTRMGPSRVGLGLGILAVFALLFALVGRLAPAEDRDEWRITQAAAVLVPFAFVLYLATNVRFTPHLHQTAMLLVLLSAAAGWLARVQGPPALALGAASASLAVMAVWVVRYVASTHAWPVAMWTCALAAVFHVFVEREPERADRDGPSPPAAVSGCSSPQPRGAARWPPGSSGSPAPPSSSSVTGPSWDASASPGPPRSAWRSGSPCCAWRTVASRGSRRRAATSRS